MDKRPRFNQPEKPSKEFKFGFTLNLCGWRLFFGITGTNKEPTISVGVVEEA